MTADTSRAPAATLKAGSGSGPCAGYRVVDMTSLVSGPYCGQILADLGAEVIKVEAAGSDLMRMGQPSNKGHAAAFEQYNRGKKSLVVDLKSEAGKAAVRKLAAGADIFLANSRPGVMERLGLGYEALAEINPGLIYVAISGFGESGPYVNRPAYDGVIQGMTGFMPIQGRAGPPGPIMSPVADKITAIWASHSTVAALLHRERTGEGQKVVVNMLGAYASFILPDPMSNHTFQSAGLPYSPPTLDVYRLLETADGHVVGLIIQESQFRGLCTAMERTDLVDDPRFATGSMRVSNIGALYDEVAPNARKLTTEAFLALTAANGVPFGKVNTIEEFFDDPQVRHARTFVDIEDPEFGTIRHLNYPADLARSPADVTRRAPKLGEHTQEILDELGLAPAVA